MTVNAGRKLRAARKIEETTGRVKVTFQPIFALFRRRGRKACAFAWDHDVEDLDGILEAAINSV